MHLTIDGFGGNPEKLASEELVRDLLDRFPERIGMTKIAPPHVQRYVGSKPEDWGVSGFVLIAESHIAVHTFPERGYVWVDIFSCKSFDETYAIRTACDAFDVDAVRPSTLPRGLEYPHAVDEAIPVAELERDVVTEVDQAMVGAAEERR
ncbi:MAG: S-adenosylmethionine decarboxylase [Dehalococcoidia bacterium]|nr:S-adenosylmethionine decarboxylase [Dehalococcoidia bacterium]MDZ4278067.1 S-adenosylmethionine decarboxylase [Dehalococcoidia bacterium]